MYFEFSRRSRSTSQPSVQDLSRKGSTSTDRGDNETTKSKVGTPSDAFRSFSFRYYNSVKNNSNSQLTPNSLQPDASSLKVVKSTNDTIPKSVSFYYQVKTPDGKLNPSYSFSKKSSFDSQSKITNPSIRTSNDSSSGILSKKNGKNDKKMSESNVGEKKFNFLSKLFTKKNQHNEANVQTIQSPNDDTIVIDSPKMNEQTTKFNDKEDNIGIKKSLKSFLIGKFDKQSEKQVNVNEIDELLKPSAQLPMVKFDDDGDFFKEPLPNQKFETEDDEKKNTNSHIIYIGDSISIDTRKAKKYLKRAFKFAFSQIGLAGLVVGYVILGALLFMKIESDYEKENQNKIEKNREEFFENVKISAEHMFNNYLNENFHTRYSIYRKEEILRKNKELPYEEIYEPLKPLNEKKNETNNIFSEYASYTNAKEVIKFDRKSHESKLKPTWFIELDRDHFYNEIKNHLRNLLIENDKIEDKDKPNMLSREDVWNYPNALLYSATVITTIGYGNITPKSNTGKVLTIFYAMIGIPLMFMCLTNTGDLLAELFIISYSKCIRFFYRRIFKHKLKIPYSSSKFEENKQEMLNEFEMEYDNPNDRHVPIVATLGVLTAYIFAGAGIFAFTEEWSILDGAYFCFITFTTIGFGDFVPGKNTLATEKRGMAALCTLYLLVGMVIMAMCFKLMQDEVASKARWFGLRLGIIEQ